MFVQERANVTIWQMRQRAADTTDGPRDAMSEAEESDSLTEDGSTSPCPSLSRLLDNLKGQQNAALAREAFNNASQIQGAIIAALEATANSIGITTNLVNEVRNIFQRMFRVATNQGDEDRANSYRRYVDNLHGMVGGT